MSQSFKCLVQLVIQSLADSTRIMYWGKWKSNDQAKDGQASTSHKCEAVKSFLASEKVKVLNHPPYSPYLSPCDFFYFQGLRKCLLEISIRLEVLFAALFIRVSKQIPKEDYLSAFRDWVKRLQKCVPVKGDTLKVCNTNMFDKT